jgi:hypothetical protein
MVFNGERRRFGVDEADNVRILIDVLGGMPQSQRSGRPVGDRSWMMLIRVQVKKGKETKPQPNPNLPKLSAIPLVVRTPESTQNRRCNATFPCLT